MMSPKKISQWQELKDKKLSGRTVAENMEFKKLQLLHEADVLTLNELKWKSELAEAVLNSALTSPENLKGVEAIINKQINDDQKPFNKKDLTDFVHAYINNAREEQKQKQSKQTAKQ